MTKEQIKDKEKLEKEQILNKKHLIDCKLSYTEILERFKHLIHIRGEKLALNKHIEIELHEEISIYEGKLREKLENHN